jgi:hypothetical protein
MNQNTFCSKCHRIPSQCCCSPADIMLRQLQAENNALRKIVDSLFDGLDSSLELNKAQLGRKDHGP